MSSPSLLLYGVLLVLVQALAALPWLAVVNWNLVRSWLARTNGQQKAQQVAIGLGGVIVVGVLLGLFLGIIQDPDSLFRWGRFYGSVLQLQLTADGFVLLFGVLLQVWPKGAAVALAAFREGLRQPMFWLIGGFFMFTIGVSVFVPYWTFGEEFVMMKELAYDLVMVATLLFALLAASLTISEEIEGRTAITLMSKPVSRRQFLVGKFLGILLATLVLTLSLGWYLNWILLLKRMYEDVPPVARPGLVEALQQAVPTLEASAFLRGAGFWFLDAWEASPGLVLGFCKMMILLSVAVALATRLPLIVNLVTCLLVYLLGNLTWVLVLTANNRLRGDSQGSAVGQMLLFVTRLFYTLLPDLHLLTIDQALISDTPPPPLEFNLYIGSVFLYAVLYTTIVLLFGLILFEDRDLA